MGSLELRENGGGEGGWAGEGEEEEECLRFIASKFDFNVCLV